MIEPNFFNIVHTAEKFKKVLINRKLTQANTKCPFCDKEKALIARINPSRRSKSGYHVHMACSNCTVQFHE